MWKIVVRKKYVYTIFKTRNNDKTFHVNITKVPLREDIEISLSKLVDIISNCFYEKTLMCIYTALIESEVPRPMKDLCCLTNSDQDKVWQYLKTDDSFYRPCLMCEYFLNSLNLTYKELKKIREKVKQLEKKFVFSPKTLIAACAYAFLREKKYSSDQEKPKSLTRLAQQLDVSPMALSRCVKKIKNY